jgi:phage major head subunit gpT-like protein
MQITDSSLKYLFNQWDLRFQDAYRAAPDPFYTKISTTIPVGTEQITMPFASRVPQLREWIGEREARSIGTYSQTYIPKDYELTLEVDRNKILDDQYGIYGFIVEDLARAAKKYPDVLLLNTLRNAQATPCYDGANFFDTVHPIDKFAGQVVAGNQQNYWSSGKPLTFDNYQTVRAAMMNFVGEDGLPFGVMPDMLIVPPQLEVTARLIVEVGSVAPGTLGGNTQVGANDNPLKGTAQVLVIPELSVDPAIWYLVDSSKGFKPFIFAQRQVPSFISITDPASENVSKRKKFLYGVDARGITGTGLWWLAAKASA